ncbi:MAG: hypothetical protein WBX49_03780 [Candidatus Deferrimicrobiaceae bacterium]
MAASLAAAPVPVRFPEGSLHGFLVLSTPKEVLIASGDLLLVGRDGDIESRPEFHFKDGSVFDETVVFTQRDVFTMQGYHLVKRGPVFPEDTEISLERASGKYHVKTKSHKDGQEKMLDGTIDLPLDAYNGMVPIVLKNLSSGARETIHMVVFTPAPKLIKLELVPAGEDRMLVGGSAKSAIHYVLKPMLGIWLKFFASLLGRMPPDNHVWIVTTDVPAFVKFEGQLYMNGPVWRIELTSPRWPDIGGFVPGRLWESLKSHQCRDHRRSAQYLKALQRFGKPHEPQTPCKQVAFSG